MPIDQFNRNSPGSKPEGKGVRNPKSKSRQSSPGGSYPTPLALSSSLPLFSYASRKETAECFSGRNFGCFGCFGDLYLSDRYRNPSHQPITIHRNKKLELKLILTNRQYLRMIPDTISTETLHSTQNRGTCPALIPVSDECLYCNTLNKIPFPPFACCPSCYDPSGPS